MNVYTSNISHLHFNNMIGLVKDVRTVDRKLKGLKEAVEVVCTIHNIPYNIPYIYALLISHESLLSLSLL